MFRQLVHVQTFSVKSKLLVATDEMQSAAQQREQNKRKKRERDRKTSLVYV